MINFPHQWYWILLQKILQKENSFDSFKLKTYLQFANQSQIGDTKEYLNSLNQTLDYEYVGLKAEIFINSLKKFKFKTKQQNGFNENYFILGDAFSISSNVLVDYKNTNYEKIEVK